MTDGNIAYLALVIGAAGVFMFVLAWASKRTSQ